MQLFSMPEYDNRIKFKCHMIFYSMHFIDHGLWYNWIVQLAAAVGQRHISQTICGRFRANKFSPKNGEAKRFGHSESAPRKQSSNCALAAD